MTRSARALALMCAMPLTFLINPASAHADAGAERAFAEQLFVEGKQLFDAGRTAAACEKLAESQRLAPGGGTLLLLGLCHEAQGKLATAWAELRSALAAARRAQRDDRVALAEEHLKAVEPRIAYVELVVADAPGLTLDLDGLTVARPIWNAPMPVDPGPHEVRAVAPGRVAWSTSFTADANGSRVRVNVPELARIAEAPVVGAPSPPLAPAVAPVGWRTPTAIAFAGVGVLSLGAMLGFGVAALGADAAKPATCPARDAACAARVDALGTRRDEMATWATGAGVTGATLLATATVLWITRPTPATPARPSAIVTPTVGGAMLHVTF